MFEKNGRWWIDYYHNGKRKRECVCPDKKLAETVLKKRIVSLAENVIDLDDRRPIMQAVMREHLERAGIQTHIMETPLTRKYLYFAQCGNAVKIGVSVNPAVRLRKMQAPDKITILQMIKNAGHLLTRA